MSMSESDAYDQIHDYRFTPEVEAIMKSFVKALGAIPDGLEYLIAEATAEKARITKEMEEQQAAEDAADDRD